MGLLLLIVLVARTAGEAIATAGDAGALGAGTAVCCTGEAIATAGEAETEEEEKEERRRAMTSARTTAAGGRWWTTFLDSGIKRRGCALRYICKVQVVLM